MNKLYIVLTTLTILIFINSKFSSEILVENKKKSLEAHKNNSIIREVNISKKIGAIDSINTIKTNKIEKIQDIISLEIPTSINKPEEKTSKLAPEIIKVSNRESIKIIINSILDNHYLGDSGNVEILESMLSEFDSNEAIEELVDIIFSNSEMSYEILQLPDTTKYAIKKVIKTGSDRDFIASKLTAIYQNSTDNKNKDRIIDFSHPETDAMIAVEAHNQGDTDLFIKMTDNLIRTSDNNEYSINGLMILARKININSIATVEEVAKKWSSYNLSKKTISLAEDYLSNGTSTPKERIIATSILSNVKNKEKVLEKAWDNENDELVRSYIDQYRYSNLKDEH